MSKKELQIAARLSAKANQWRTDLDRQLEAAGLLNYQTAGQSASTVQAKVAAFEQGTGISVAKSDLPRPPVLAYGGQVGVSDAGGVSAPGAPPKPAAGEMSWNQDVAFTTELMRIYESKDQEAARMAAQQGGTYVGQGVYVPKPAAPPVVAGKVSAKPAAPNPFAGTASGFGTSVPAASLSASYVPAAGVFGFGAIQTTKTETVIKNVTSREMSEREWRMKYAADSVPPPAFTMVQGKDGSASPIYSSFADQTYENLKRTLNESGASPLESFALKAGFQIGRALDSPIGRAVQGYAIELKEAATDSDPTIVGAVMNTMYQGILAGGSGLLYLGTLYNGKMEDAMIARLDAEANELEKMLLNGEVYRNRGVTLTPWQTSELMEKKRAQADQILEDRVDAKSRWIRYSTAVTGAWDKLEGAIDKWNQDPPPIFHPGEDRAAHMKEYAAWELREDMARKQATMESSDFAAKSMELLTSGSVKATNGDETGAAADFNAALELRVQSIEARKKADQADSFGAYSWASDPDAEKQYIKQVANFELQVGRYATEEEILQIKDLYVNIWVEMGGEVLFDATTLLGPLLVGGKAALKGGIELLGFSVKGLGKLAYGTKIGAAIADNAILPVIRGAVKFADKTPLKMFYTETWRTIATKAADHIGNNMQSIVRAYDSTEDLLVGIDDAAQMAIQIEEARKLPLGIGPIDPSTGVAATKIVDQGEEFFNMMKGSKRAGSGFYQNMSYEQYKKFIDASGSIRPEKWAEMFRASVDTTSSEIFRRKAIAELKNSDLVGDALETEIQKIIARKLKDPKEMGGFIGDFSKKFGDAILDQHRIFSSSFDPARKTTREASALLDDSLLGWIAKNTYKLSGSKVPMELIDGAVKIALTVKGIWVTSILTLNPGYVIRNIIDSSYRDAVTGGHMFDDIISIFRGMHTHLADDLGMVPLQVGQNLAQEGLDFMDTLMSRMLYQGWRPSAGIFSYFDFELQRLKNAKFAGRIEAEAADRMSKQFPPGLRGMWMKTWNGMKGAVDDLQFVPGAVIGGAQSFNTSVEFTLRLRKFHREYFKALDALEPAYKTVGLDALSPRASELAKQIWKLSNSNPAMISKLVDGLAVGDKNATKWADSLPPEFGSFIADPSERALFVDGIRTDVDNFIYGTMSSKGRLPTNKESKEFVQEAIDNFQNEYSLRMDTNALRREVDEELNPDKIVASDLDVSTLRGSAPTPPVARPQFPGIAQKKVKPVEQVEGFAGTMYDFAEVRRVPGKAVTVAKDAVTGEPVIQVGEKLKGKALFEQIREGTLTSLRMKDETAILAVGGYKSLAPGGDYDSALRQFISNPMSMRNEREEEFIFIATQLERYPEIWDVLRKTGNVPDYTDAMENYRRFGTIPDTANMSALEMEAFVESSALKTDAHAVEGRALGVSSAKLFDAVKALDSAGADKAAYTEIRKFTEYMFGLRAKWQNFLLFQYPGPKRANEIADAIKWSNWNAMSATSYRSQRVMQDDFLEMLKRQDIPAALERAKQFNADPATMFLKEQGVEIKWDDLKLHITSGTFVRDGVRTPLVFSERKSIEEMFRQSIMPANPAIKMDVTDRLQKGISMRGDFMNNLQRHYKLSWRTSGAIMKSIDNQAKWAAKHGIPEEIYYGRFQFKKGVVDNAIRTTPDGDIIFYGMGANMDLTKFVKESSDIFYSDLELILKTNPHSAVGVDLKGIHDYIEASGGGPVAGALTPLQRDIMHQGFVDYIIEGTAKGIKRRKPFESYKRQLSRVYGGIVDEKAIQIQEELSTVLNRVLLSTKGEPPTSGKAAAILEAMGLPKEVSQADLLRQANIQAYKKKLTKELLQDSPSSLLVDLPDGTVVRMTGQWAYEGNRIPVQDWKTAEWRDITYEDLLASTLRNEKTDEIWRKPTVVKTVKAQDTDTQKAAIAKLRPTDGWKLHLATDDPETVSKLLTGMGLSHKVGRNAGQAGKDVTIYIGSRADADKAAENISKKLGSFLKDPYGDTLTDDIQLANKVVGRFDISADPEFHQYGKGGTPFLKDDIIQQKYGSLTQEESLKRSDDLLKNRYGSFYAGEPKLPGVAEATKKVKESFKARMDAVRGELKVIDEKLFPSVENAVAIPDGPEKIALVARKEELDAQLWTMSVPEELLAAIKKVEDDAALKNTPTPMLDALDELYEDLSEVPEFDLRSLAIEFGAPRRALWDGEIQQAFDVWKKGDMWKSVPPESLTDVPSLRRYLKSHLDDPKMKGEAAQFAMHRLWSLEEFESAMLRAQVDLKKAIPEPSEFIPSIKPFQMGSGHRNWIALNERITGQWEAATQELKTLEDWLVNKKYQVNAVPKEIIDELRQWAVPAMINKAELVDVLINGGTLKSGRNHTGAIKLTNDVMIDYTTNTRFDQLMKNIFPFWTFPTRSLPFWADTLATHPQIIAAYEKFRRFTAAQQRQQGMVTSDGQQIPGMRGYFNIPGTEIWFNPLAPFSFNYILAAMNKEPRDFFNQARTREDVPPGAFMAKTLMETSPQYGFSMAPWTIWLAKKYYDIPDNVLSQWPLTPHFSLFPRWMYQSMISAANTISNGHLNLQPTVDKIYPEVSWHDYLVEKDLLEYANQRMETMSTEDAERYIMQVRNAIREKGENSLWQEQYHRTTNQEAYQSMSSFFTGFYMKKFGDMEVDLIRMNIDNNLKKSALNNKFQSYIFDLPMDAHAAWEMYNDNRQTPEGWLYRTYKDIGYVTDDKGMYIRDPAERAKALAVKLTLEDQQVKYYGLVKDAQVARDQALIDLGVGAPYEQYAEIYTKYYARLDTLESMNTYDTKYGTDAPVEIIQEKLSDQWYRYVWRTRPVHAIDSLESWDAYQARIKEWELNLPRLAPTIMLNFQKLPYVQNLRLTLDEDQKLTANIWGQLTKMVTPESIQFWQRKNDTVLDALDSAWGELYWNKYWDTVMPLKGYERTAAEQQFMAMPPPDTNALYSWVEANYPGRFTLAEVRKWAEYEDNSVWSLDRRLTEDQTEDEKLRSDVWRMLAAAGPAQSDVINLSLTSTYKAQFQDWYDKDGLSFQNDIEGLREFTNALAVTLQKLNVKTEPSQEQLMEYMQAESLKNELHRSLAAKYDITVEMFELIRAEYANVSPKEYKKQSPSEYEMMQYYYRIRKGYGYQNPLYAQYYLKNVIDPISPESEMELMQMGLTPSAPPAAIPGTPTVTQPPATAPATTGTTPLPAAPPSTSGSDFGMPPEMKKTLSPLMILEVQFRVESGAPLSAVGKAYFTKLMSYHPEWVPYISSLMQDP